GPWRPGNWRPPPGSPRHWLRHPPHPAFRRPTPRPRLTPRTPLLPPTPRLQLTACTPLPRRTPCHRRLLGPRRTPCPPPGPRRPGPSPAGRLRPVALLAAAAGVVLLVAAAAVVGARVLSPGAGTGAPAAPAKGGPFAAPSAGLGIPTVTSGCPAASVPGAGARCPRDPECWAGLVITAGSASARSLPCTRPHVWQTFAIAILSAGVRTFDADRVAGNPTVSAVCSTRVLLASRRATALGV